MSGPRPIRWLHLSDLHLGCPGRELWWQVHQEFERSVRERAAPLGMPDLILMTGDLTYSRKKDEFRQLDGFLDLLLGWLRDAVAGGRDPLILPVPGNHDLVWPSSREVRQYRILDKYDLGRDDRDIKELEVELWDKRDASLFEPRFAAYQTWFNRRIQPELQKRAASLNQSHFPGDFSVEIEIKGALPLAVIGLNSAWMQYEKEGDFDGKLQIPTGQFHAALSQDASASPLEIFKRCPRALVLMHHPLSWLSKKSRKSFVETIYTPDRFTLCLHGHMHDARAEGVAFSGGKPRYYFQSPSLFGLKHYGKAKEERAMGYTWGSLSAEGVVRVWPLERVIRGGGEAAFVHDDEFPEDREGVQIRPVRVEQEQAAAQTLDLEPYLESLLARTGHINISGIGSGRGRVVKTAARYPIERLYTPLRTRAELEAGSDPMRPAEGGPVSLAEILPRHGRLLIEGQPGAGKTTFLRFVASMLARDAVGTECPEGGSWRKRYLGIDARSPLKAPVFLRLSSVVPLLTGDSPPGREDNREWLLDLVDTTHLTREQWESLFDRGEAMLLLDGLDEVADERLRQRLFDIFADACSHWSKCPVVVTSRPIDTRTLREMGFHHATIEPFGRAEIETFIDQWVAALYEREPGEALDEEAKRYQGELLSALVERPGIRMLATNPVMLTSLCVVHWNEGRLPDGRSRVYRAVIRWLIAARTTQRVKGGFSDWFADRAFARLALSMMSTREGKRAVVDLEEGALAVEPILERDFPKLAPEDRRQRARDWLRFECLWSGIIEEVAGNRIRFWHLTFQEFLAALQLSWRGDGDKDEQEDYWPLVKGHLDGAQCRETIELLPGCLLDEGGEGRVDKLLSRVLALRGKKPDLAGEARVAGIVGRLLLPLDALQFKPRQEISQAYKAALDRSMEIFKPEGAKQVR